MSAKQKQTISNQPEANSRRGFIKKAGQLGLGLGLGINPLLAKEEAEAAKASLTETADGKPFETDL